MLRRKIPLNYRNITGVAHSTPDGDPTPFESTLERDFIEIIRFDTAIIRSYESQTPVIHYEDDNGRTRRYTPDLYVEYADGRKVIYEVKPRELLWKHWPEFKPKFKQAIRYGRRNGIKFKIVTENEIRTDYLKNIKFLSGYRSAEPYDPRYQLLLNKLHTMNSSTPSELVRLVGYDLSTQAELLHILWRLLADHLIDTDLCEPLSMDSPIWRRLGGLG